ncbi:MAG: VCBS repeat-containing protein [Solirubrobacterales bacterium]|nr:VCBS repeat-containing protein [Solirubrobacterales bacterium]
MACMSAMAFVLMADSSATAAQFDFNPAEIYATGEVPSKVVAADIDQDSDNDLITPNPGPGSRDLTFLAGSADGSFSAPVSFGQEPPPFDPPGTEPAPVIDVAVGQFDAGADPDLAVLYYGSRSLSVLLGGAGSSFSAPQSLGFDLGPLGGVVTGDFDGDGNLDLALSPGESIQVALGNGDGTFEPVTNDARPGTQWMVLRSAADINRDGNLDLIATSDKLTSSALLVFPGNGDGTFGVATTVQFVNAPYGAVAGDLNGDDWPDVVYTDGGGVRILFGDGSGGLEAPVAAPSPGSGDPAPPTLFDLDGDSDLDMISPLGAGFAVIPGVGDGSFEEPQQFPRGGTGSSLVVVNLNADSDPDVAMVAPGLDGPVSVAFNGRHQEDPPEFTGSVPEGPANSDSVTLKGTAEPGTTVRIYGNETCEGSKVAVGSSGDFSSTGLEVPVPQDSTSSWSATAVNAVGVASNCSSPFAFEEDSTPPETSVDSGPALTNEVQPSFGFSSPDGSAGFECSFDDQPFGACSGPGSHASPVPLAEGTHTFLVRSFDPVGNIDPTPASREFTVDTTPPETTQIRDVVGEPAHPSFFIFELESSEPGIGFQCRLDADPFSACLGGLFSVGIVSDGDHTFEGRAIDEAGNVDPTPVEESFATDTVVPDTTITAGPTGATSDATPTFTFTATKPNQLFTCRMDSVLIECSGASSHTPPVPLSAGAHTFDVSAGRLGNVDPTPASRAFVVDPAPVVSIDSGPSGATGPGAAVFTFGANEPGVGFQCRMDGAGFSPCSSPKSYDALAAGSHTFSVRGTDSSGGVSNTATRTWEIVQGSTTHTVQGNAPPGGAVTTDAGSTGPSDSRPVTASITVPDGGAVSITEQESSVDPPSGFATLGRQFDIEAPGATVERPLVLVFRLDSSSLPPGTTASSLTMLRGSQAAPDCTGSTGVAAPDPCVSGRRTLQDGDVEISVLSSHASVWVAVRAVGGAPATRCVVPKLKGKPLNKAKKKIRQARCGVGKVRRKKSGRRKAGSRLRGKVISQKPGPGKKLKQGSKISLVIGK